MAEPLQPIPPEREASYLQNAEMAMREIADGLGAEAIRGAEVMLTLDSQMGGVGDGAERFANGELIAEDAEMHLKENEMGPRVREALIESIYGSPRVNNLVKMEPAYYELPGVAEKFRDYHQKPNGGEDS